MNGDSLSRAKRRGSYSAALSRLAASILEAWSVKDYSVGELAWRMYSVNGAPQPDQGWKVHVSTGAAQAVEFLNCVIPVLADLKASFKLPQGIAGVVFLNSGDGGATQVGKILTVYSRDDDHARKLILALDDAWPVSAGPEIRTGMHVRPGSAVAFRYGAFSAGPIVVDSRGLYAFAVRQSDGDLIADLRTAGMGGAGFPPPLTGFPPANWPVALNGRVEVGDRTFLILSQLKEATYTLTLLAADVENFETAVLKIGRENARSGLDDRTLAEHLRNEHDLLAFLADSGVAPKPLGFRPSPWPVLAMEDIRGVVLADLGRDRLIAGLAELARTVARLHDAGVVHGDVKLENAILRDGLVVLIDFELAQLRGRTMRPGGTDGHLAAEAGAQSLAHPTRDVYALGGCLFQAAMDFPPGLLPSGAERQAALLENEGLVAAAGLSRRLMAAAPEARPCAAHAAVAIDALAFKTDGSLREPDMAWARQAAVSAGRLVRTFAEPRTVGTAWRNTHFLRDFDAEALNLGAAGIILGLSAIDTASGHLDFQADVAAGADWLRSQNPAGKSAGLFTGNAGVCLALAIAGRRLGKQDHLDAARDRLAAAAADRRELDLFSGAAGVVWAACLLADAMGELWPLDIVAPAFIRLSRHVQHVDGIPVWRFAGHPDSAFLGCAHGSAGVALAYAAWGSATGDPSSTSMALETFHALAKRGRTADGMAMRIANGAPRHHTVGNWCHGVAGHLWAMLAAFGDHASLAGEIDWAVQILAAGASVGTPTYCHGLAGHLEIWRMLGSVTCHRSLAERQAAKTAQALRILQTQIGREVAWISDDPAVITPDLWIGFLGPASALALYAAGERRALLSSGVLTSMCNALPSQSARGDGDAGLW